MAWTITQNGGWLKHAETTAIPDVADGETDTSDSPEVPVTGVKRVMVKADEDSTSTVAISAKLYYTLDDAVSSIGGVGADPTAAGTTGTVTWVEAELGGALADNTLAMVDVPSRAKKVKVQYAMAPVGAAISSHAGMGTEIHAELLDSSLGFEIGGIGADPS